MRPTPGLKTRPTTPVRRSNAQDTLREVREFPDLAVRPAETLRGHAQLQQHRVLQIGQRCALGTDYMTPAFDFPAAASDHETHFHDSSRDQSRAAVA